MTTTDASELALNGGQPVRTAPWPIRKLFGPDDKQAVCDLFDRAIEAGSDVLGYQKAEEEAYCQEFADFLGGGFADGVNSGTNAVWVALRSLELPPGSEVIVPPISDPGGVMPVALCNCIPVPADTAPGSYNAGPEQIAERITDRTSAIVVAHIAGMPCDMPAICDLARSENLSVVEDCAQAHGATINGRSVGTFGDVAAFSLMFGKHHAVGGQGGVVFTTDEDRYWKVRRLADRGKPFNVDAGGGNVAGSINCNMDELHAAVGRSQLRRLSETLQRRRNFARALANRCRDSLQTIRCLEEPPGVESAFWFILFHVDFEKLSCDREQLLKALAAEGLNPGGYWHVPTEMAWHRERNVFGLDSDLPWSLADRDYPLAWDLPNAAATEASHFRIQFHEDFGPRELDDIAAILEKVQRAYLR